MPFSRPTRPARHPGRHAPPLRMPALLALASCGALAGCGAARQAPAAESVLRAEAAAQRAIADERALGARELPARTVGVAPLDAPAGDSNAVAIAYGVADLLTTDLAQASQLRVVERLRTDAILRELRLAGSGQVDSATAPRVGRLVGARNLVLGSVRSAGDRFTLDARLADVTTGGVRSGGSEEASLDQVLAAEAALAIEILESLGVTLTPAERTRIEQRPTRNVGAFLAYGRGVRAEAAGDWRAARDHFRRAVTLDPSFARARVRADRASAMAAVRDVGDVRPSSALRAASLANAGVNRPLNGALPPRTADAAFPLQQLVTLLLTVTVP
ncbi:MAG: CsgG/HfaB family protein [Gemmatirosa sp.]